MEEGSPMNGLIVFAVLVLADALFYGFGAAIQALNLGEVSKKREEGDKNAKRLLQIIENPTNTVNTIQIVSSIVSIILGIVEIRVFGGFITKLLTESFQWTGSIQISVLSNVLSGIIMIYFLMCFGILIPKKLASKRPESWAYNLINLLSGIIFILKPFTYLINGTTNLVIRIFGIDPNENEDDVTEEEIISMVIEGHEQGVLQASEAEMIHNIFELGDKEAKDIMTHRKNMIVIDGTECLDDVLNFILGQSNSRFPVYMDDIDNIIGVLHFKDAMKFHKNPEFHQMPITDIEGLIREVKFIPETRNIDLLFKNMQFQKIHMVVVVDEYGQTSGLVAMEDILEEIVGNILDEYDEDENYIMRQIDGTFIIEGRTPLDDVEDVLGMTIEEEDYDTLNGLLISELDRIPSEEEQPEICIYGYMFKVLSVQNKTIEKVSVRKMTEEELEEMNQSDENTEE